MSDPSGLHEGDLACRGVIELLAVASVLHEAIGLEKLPHGSTLKKFAEHDAFVKHGGADTVSSYQLRTVLRFLKQAKPDLINGIRDGYKVLFDDAETFKANARRAMAAL